MAQAEEETRPAKAKLIRCVDWLQKQNELEPKKLSLQNKNDIQFIIECNAQRKKFLLSVAENDSVPAGVDEPPVDPVQVPLRRLRVDCLRMLCEWQECQCYFVDYELFQKHVVDHTSLEVSEGNETVKYMCLWDICGHSTSDFDEMVRHMNYHAYHARLLSIGFNGRATLKLERCKKDSSKRNKVPSLKTQHGCMWTGCYESFNSIQAFFDHVKVHIYLSSDSSSEHLCSWAGCGEVFPRRTLLTMHARSHTGESLIACYHCGRHFACNRKLRDHLARQNVRADLGHQCNVCSQYYATAYLLREHTRQHVCAYACHLCTMSATSPAALASHVRYRHVAGGGARCHACALCPYRAVTKSDLQKHMATHNRKTKSEEDDSSDVGPSDEEDSDGELKRKKKVPRKYACHICPEREMKVFSRGTRLTTHLVKVHGAQWPFGYSRFRYQLSDDGIYRLTTTRIEYLELSQEIVGGYSRGPKGTIYDKKLKFDVKQVAEATENTPNCFEITLEDGNELNMDFKPEIEKTEPDNAVEITMCDVDEHGNIISSKVINSDYVFT
ncbi:histone H4 transcription factor [Epargyreus clarus]|uniref:histone H4 transcription factor n=1 Tax=Epargyreus clarus TaxID=520877 RepID=UPI003C2F278F